MERAVEGKSTWGGARIREFENPGVLSSIAIKVTTAELAATERVMAGGANGCVLSTAPGDSAASLLPGEQEASSLSSVWRRLVVVERVPDVGERRPAPPLHKRHPSPRRPAQQRRRRAARSSRSSGSLRRWSAGCWRPHRRRPSSCRVRSARSGRRPCSRSVWRA